MGAKIQFAMPGASFLIGSAGLVLVLLINCDAGDPSPALSALAPQTRSLLEQVGTPQGESEEAKLEGTYEDPRQQEIPFGRISFYLTPWRAYMDTWPAQQYLDSLGINLKVPLPTLRATAKILAQAGFRSARVELGWGNLGYYDLATNPPCTRLPGNFSSIESGRSPTIGPFKL